MDRSKIDRDLSNIEDIELSGYPGYFCPCLITRCRVAVGLTQAQLAEKLMVDTRTVQRWEQGKDSPSEEHADKLKDIFGIDPAHPDQKVELEIWSEWRSSSMWLPIWLPKRMEEELLRLFELEQQRRKHVRRDRSL